MPVTASATGLRVLRVLEAIATHQPVGIRALARLLNDDKSAVHRAIMTLAEDGWIRPTVESVPRWQVSNRLVSLAEKAFGEDSLKRRARPIMERLRDRCGETIALVVLEGEVLIVSDFIESKRSLRWVPLMGIVAPADTSAAGRILMPYLDAAQQRELLGREPEPALQQIYADSRTRGYAVSDRETNDVAASVGAVIFDAQQRPCAVITIVGPSERIAAAGHEALGQLVRTAAQAISLSKPTAQITTSTATAVI